MLLILCHRVALACPSDASHVRECLSARTSNLCPNQTARQGHCAVKDGWRVQGARGRERGPGESSREPRLEAAGVQRFRTWHWQASDFTRHEA